MTIYVVKSRETGSVLALVEGKLPSQAVAHVARSTIVASVAKPHELFSLARSGFEIQYLGSANQQLEIPAEEECE